MSTNTEVGALDRRLAQSLRAFRSARRRRSEERQARVPPDGEGFSPGQLLPQGDRRVSASDPGELEAGAGGLRDPHHSDPAAEVRRRARRAAESARRAEADAGERDRNREDRLLLADAGAADQRPPPDRGTAAGAH